jgi:uncharacterized surface protein with fasciclin (FAS1) repeats
VKIRTPLATAGLALIVATSVAACSSSSNSSTASGSTAASAAASAPMASSPMASTPMASGSTASAPFGSACSAVPASGAGSFNGMETAPVATAASANPVLTTLVKAVTAAGLGDTLNSASNITVFAPANSAFAKVPAATLTALLANKAELTSILTYHVIGQRLSPSQLLSGGSFKTLNGATLKVTGSGQTIMVNGTTNVVCGDVQTANATVYIIDSVLMPPAMTSSAAASPASS